MAEVIQCPYCRRDLYEARRPTRHELLASVVEQHLLHKHRLRWVWFRINRHPLHWIRVFRANDPE